MSLLKVMASPKNRLLHTQRKYSHKAQARLCCRHFEADDKQTETAHCSRGGRVRVRGYPGRWWGSCRLLPACDWTAIEQGVIWEVAPHLLSETRFLNAPLLSQPSPASNFQDSWFALAASHTHVESDSFNSPNLI